MAKYRSLEPVTYVEDGKVVSASADREFELDEAQATLLAGRVVRLAEPAPSMFPDGVPVIDHVIVRSVPATPVAGEAVEAPAPEKPAKK